MPTAMNETGSSEYSMVRDWRFWAGLGAGALAGAVVSLLYAPVKGSEMRQRIGDGATEAVNRATDAAQTGITTYGTTARVAQFQIERLYRAVAEGVEEARRVRGEMESSRKLGKYERGNCSEGG